MLGGSFAKSLLTATVVEGSGKVEGSFLEVLTIRLVLYCVYSGGHCFGSSHLLGKMGK